MSDHLVPTLLSERGLTMADLHREQREVRHNMDSPRPVLPVEADRRSDMTRLSAGRAHP